MPLPIRSVGLIPCNGTAPFWVQSKPNNVSEVRDSWPSLSEDGAGVGVDLREADGAPSCSLKSKVESADA
jgi:hypothetical protein